MGLFSRLFNFGSKSIPAVEHTRKVLQLTESPQGYPVVTWEANTVTIHTTVISVRQLRLSLLQGCNLPIGWQSVYVSGSQTIDNLEQLVVALESAGYVHKHYGTRNGVLQLAEGVVIV